MNVFYSSGLKFSCKRCSACCRHDSGFVYLSEEDLEKISAQVNMDRESFILTYCRWAEDWQGEKVLSLKEKQNNDCIFWNSGCGIYNARPLQCITYPFWEYIVESKTSWENAGKSCPGINSGTLYGEKEIEGFLKMRSAETIVNKKGAS